MVIAGCTGGSVFSLNRTGDIVWDFSTDGEVPVFSINSQATKIVAGTTNGTLYLLDNKGALLWTYHDDGVMNKQVTALEISRDGSSIIAVINNRDLLYFTTPEILPVSLAQSPTGNLSTTKLEVKVSGLDPLDTSIILQKPVNSSAPLTGNSKLFTELCDIIWNLKSGGLIFDYRGGTSSRITVDPLVIFPHGNTFDNTRNLSGILSASNSTAVKSSPAPTKTSTGIVTASNNTTVKSSPVPTKNSTGIVAASNNTTVKSSSVPTKNSTGIVAASNNTTVKASPSRSINSTQVNAAGLDMQNNTMMIGHTLNFSSLQMGNSRLFIENRAVIRNFKSGGLPFDHRGINNRWITLDPPLVLPAGNIFSLSKNSTGIVAASNNTTVKSNPAPTKNSTGIVAASNKTTVKSSPVPTKNSTDTITPPTK
ncbi:MAG: hypothetical protein NTV68_16840 [Methanomicrobiales archaeon]|nr:hypothetical protein [Methanomicrobiales archaeon]